MISDVLFQAVSEMDCYLNDPVLGKAYTGEMRKDIGLLRDQMVQIISRLDTPPQKTAKEKTK